MSDVFLTKNFSKPSQSKFPVSVFVSAECLNEMLADRQVQILFQPIVRLDTQQRIGFEALGRGSHSDLSSKPTDLFRLAERCGLASSLSQMFRHQAVQESNRLPGKGFLFLNLHPEEMTCDHLAASVSAHQATLPKNWQVVLEINENAVADLPCWEKLRLQLKKQGILVAYDDFGAGQARILELADIPPDFIKVDMGLVRNIHLNSARQNIVGAIIQSCEKLGVQVIAEGIENEGEAQAFRSLGCSFGQGYLFATPKSPVDFCSCPALSDTAAC